MKNIITINWKQYKEIATNTCSTCGVICEWIHLCSWPTYPWSHDYSGINPVIQSPWATCLWDSVPENPPWSGIKRGALSCSCPRCSPTF